MTTPFMGAYSAQIPIPGYGVGVQAAPFVTMAPDPSSAFDQGCQAALRRWPVDQGWFNHAVVVEPILSDVARRIGEWGSPGHAQAKSGLVLARERVEANLALATLCDMVLGEDAPDRSDWALIQAVGVLLQKVKRLGECK